MSTLAIVLCFIFFGSAFAENEETVSVTEDASILKCIKLSRDLYDATKHIISNTTNCFVEELQNNYQKIKFLIQDLSIQVFTELKQIDNTTKQCVNNDIDRKSAFDTIACYNKAATKATKISAKVLTKFCNMNIVLNKLSKLNIVLYDCKERSGYSILRYKFKKTKNCIKKVMKLA